MSKTIREMAEEYAYTNWEDEDYHEGAAEGLPFDAIGHTEKTYMAGANAVLEKVECCLNRISVDNHSDDDLEDLYDTLCEMVKNFKEE